MKKIDKELVVLYIAYYTGNEHILQIKKDNKAVPVEAERLLSKLKRLLMMYSKRIIDLKNYLANLSEEISEESKKIKPAKRFQKNIRVDEDGDVIVNGLLTAACLVMQHRNIRNKILIPDYKLAEKVYLNYELEKNKSLDNSRGLAKTILRKVQSEV